MWPLLRFLFFNAGLPTADVVTDLINYVTLRPDHPRWAEITLTWMFTSFTVHATLFFIKQIKALWRRRGTTCNIQNFHKQVLIHLPGIATLHNLWMAWKLKKLKYGTRDFKTEDHEKVEKILAEAGRCSHGESMYEAGPQSVTQVNSQIIIFLECFIYLQCNHYDVFKSKYRTNHKNTFSAGCSPQHGPMELFPTFLHLHFPLVSFLGSF